MEDQNRTDEFQRLRKIVNIRRKNRTENKGNESHLRPLLTALSAFVILCLIVFFVA